MPPNRTYRTQGPVRPCRACSVVRRESGHHRPGQISRMPIADAAVLARSGDSSRPSQPERYVAIVSRGVAASALAKQLGEAGSPRSAQRPGPVAVRTCRHKRWRAARAWASEVNSVSFKNSSSSLLLKLSMKAFCTLPGSMECQSTLVRAVHDGIVFEVSSVPLSLPTVLGLPCRAIRRSSSRLPIVGRAPRRASIPAFGISSLPLARALLPRAHDRVRPCRRTPSGKRNDIRTSSAKLAAFIFAMIRAL
jgi:hypothetical protein